MSDRPKWMPDFLPTWPGGTITTDFYRTGLRAQIAVLEEVIHQPAYDQIAARIAALRKEIE